MGPALVDVGDREAEALVLDVCLHALVLLEKLRQAFLPGVAADPVEHYVVEVRLVRRRIHDDLAGHEVYVVGAPRWGRSGE